MGINNSIRGGAGAGRGDNPHSFGPTQTWNVGPANPGGKSHVVRVTPKGDDYHDVHMYEQGDLGTPVYSASNVYFGHNQSTNQIEWGGGKSNESKGSRTVTSGPYND